MSYRTDAIRIAELAAKTYGVQAGDILRPRQRRGSAKLIRARHVSRHALRRWREASLADVGAAFGCDHSSVSNSLRQVEGDAAMLGQSQDIVRAVSSGEPTEAQFAAIGRELWSFAKVSDAARMMLEAVETRIGRAAE